MIIYDYTVSRWGIPEKKQPARIEGTCWTSIAIDGGSELENHHQTNR